MTQRRSKEILTTVWLTITQEELIKPGEGIILGVSGGADSIALMTVLHRLNQEYQQGWKLYVAHLNHGIRGKEAQRDAKFVKAVGQRFGLPVYIDKVNVLLLAKKQRLSLEAAGRQARYDFLKKIARKCRVAKVAVGHTLDDQAETVLGRIIRGCGLRGLSGIRTQRPLFLDTDDRPAGHKMNLIRPLIKLSRREIEEFLAQQRISYQTDATNFDRTITRNRIRLELIPYLEKYHHRIKYHLFQLARVGQQASAYLEQAARVELKKQKMWQDGWFNVVSFAKLAPALQIALLDEFIKKTKGNLKNIEGVHYQGILEFILTPGRGTKEIHLADGLRIRKEYGWVKFWCDRQRALDAAKIARPTDLYLETEILKNNNGYLKKFKVAKTSQEEIFDLDKISFPLRIRYRLKGDGFQPLGTKGNQSLKKFFIDHKIPQPQRDLIPLLLSKNKIIWIVESRIDERYKVTPKTKSILKIKVKRLTKGQFVPVVLGN